VVEHPADKPPDTNVDAWLADLSKTANLCPHISEQRLTLNGLPALKVRYRTANEDETEAVFVVSGLRTFEIYFGGEMPRVPLENLHNYPTYLEMLGTFRVKGR
jgi:hypothetical protein